MSDGGVAVFPADTVYGLACDPEAGEAVARLHALKGRELGKPAAVMFFDLALALAAVPELGERTRAAFGRLLPGGLTLLVSNPAGRFPLACAGDPATLGIRVPLLSPALEPLAAVGRPVMQSSANHTGEPDPRRLGEIPPDIRAGVDLVLDAGELPGTPSTVVDLRRYEDEGVWEVLRAGAVDPAHVAALVDEP
jgi:L-threonylcarbamoyladenylate synthase